MAKFSANFAIFIIIFAQKIYIKTLSSLKNQSLFLQLSWDLIIKNIFLLCYKKDGKYLHRLKPCSCYTLHKINEQITFLKK